MTWWSAFLHTNVMPYSVNDPLKPRPAVVEDLWRANVPHAFIQQNGPSAISVRRGGKADTRLMDPNLMRPSKSAATRRYRAASRQVEIISPIAHRPTGKALAFGKTE